MIKETKHQLNKMAQITTHILNALDGTHASSVEVKLSVHGTEIFSGMTDEGGRLKFCIDISIYESTDEFSLSFGIGRLFNAKSQNKSGVRINYSTLSFQMPEKDGQYHIPVIMSPNGCSFWWSG